MLKLIPRISNTGLTGISLLTFAAGKLSPHATPPVLLYVLTTIGATLIISDAVAFATRLLRQARAAGRYAPTGRNPTAP
jgi:hypothetical protein